MSFTVTPLYFLLSHAEALVNKMKALYRHIVQELIPLLYRHYTYYVCLHFIKVFKNKFVRIITLQ